MRSWAFSGLSGVWADVLRYRRSLILLMLLALVARAQSITGPMYSIDGYVPVRDDPVFFPVLLSNGRWGFVALAWLSGKIGYLGMDVVPSALVLSTALFLGAGFLYARVLLTSFSVVELVTFVALFTLHPFNTEFYTFSDTTLSIAISIFLAAAGLACASTTVRPPLGAVTGALLMLTATSIYQLALIHAVIVGLLAAIARIARFDSSRCEHRGFRRVLGIAPIRALVVVVVIAAVSFVSMIVISRAHIAAPGIRANLARVPTLSEVPDFKKKVVELATAFRMAFVPPPGIVPPFMSILLICIVTLAAMTILLSILRRVGMGMAIVASGVLAAATISSVIAPVTANVVWLVPRVLSPFSILVAGIATLGWRCTRLSWVRHILAVALAVLSLSYVGISNRILYDQRRVNLWDMQEANRILARLESKTDFGDIRALALVNGDWRRSLPLATAVGDMNLSAFAVWYAKLGLVEQATGFHFARPTPAEMQTAQTYCDAAGVWPVADSVVIIGDLGIVCLRRP